MEGIRVNLISGRTAVQGQNLDSKLSDEYFAEVARCDLNSADMEKLGVAKNDTVKVTTQYGQVVVRADQDDGLQVGMVFVPMGPWANAVVSGDTHGAGMPSFKGIAATVEKTTEPILPVAKLMRTYMT
ncbi:MAG: molybdopterin dinucleotide binding domain-containing protein [Candidatus Methanospirareceae archaeon]